MWPLYRHQVFVGNPLEEEITMSGKYNEEVAKRLLYLKKLDGFPVIRMMVEDDSVEVSATLDLKEIQRMAGEVEEEERSVAEAREALDQGPIL